MQKICLQFSELQAKKLFVKGKLCLIRWKKIPEDSQNYARPTFNILNNAQIEKIKDVAFHILENVGVTMSHPGARDILRKAGAILVENRVRVPRSLVERCIALAPKGFTLFTRDGKPLLELRGKNFYYGTSTASPYTRDALTGEIHNTQVEDLERSAKIADSLSNIDYVMPMGSAQDVPAKCSDLYEFLATVSNTNKPIVTIALTTNGLRGIIEMAEIIAGGKDALLAKPFIINYPEPVTPLTYPDEPVEKMLVAAEYGIPQLVGPTVQPGATGPVTLAGSIAQLVAEGLMSVVLIQLKNPGVPCFLAGNINIFDMRTTLMSVAAPEMSLGISAHAEVARSFGLPTWGMAGCADSKIVDAQAGAESAFALLAQALGGLNLIHDIGYLDMGMICSAEMLVLGDEIVGMVKRFMQGINISDEMLAEDVIKQVGPAGDFIHADHTFKHFKKELWSPKLFTRESFKQWETKGKKDTAERIREKIKKILETHKPLALPSDTLQKLHIIKDKYEKIILGS